MLCFPDTIRKLEELLPPFEGQFSPPVPDSRVSIDRAQFKKSGRSAPRGSGHGPLGSRYEHLTLACEDQYADEFEARYRFTEHILNGDAPPDVESAYMASGLTPLRKKIPRLGEFQWDITQ